LTKCLPWCLCCCLPTSSSSSPVNWWMANSMLNLSRTQLALKF
jgi:hypothetical protein